jgi:4-azaleucine resistance transporter AzlC
MVAVMTFFINARHIFYGISFIEEFREIGKQKHSFWKYPYMALTVTDETYSVLCSLECPEGINKQKVEFYILFLCHMLWIASCTAGALVGNMIPLDMTGIDFSATAFFCVVVVNQWRQSKSHLPALTGLISAVIFYAILGADNFILPALSVSMIFLVVSKDRMTASGRCNG